MSRARRSSIWGTTLAVPGSNQRPIFYIFKEPRTRFQGTNSASLCSLAGRYDNPIPTRFLAPIDCFKIPALFLGTMSVLS